MKLLRKLRVSQSIAIIIILPTFLLIVSAAIIFSHYQDSINTAKKSQDIVLISQLFDSIAHTHAVERGTTAGFLGSGGTKGREAMLKARDNSDAAQLALRSFDEDDLRVFDKIEFNRLRQQILASIQSKIELRRTIDDLQPSTNPFAFYSNINRVALESIQHIALKTADDEQISLMEAQLNLLWLKERAGQYRGGLNAVFAAKRVDLNRKIQINSFITDETNRENLFLTWAHEDLSMRYRALQRQEHWKQVSTIKENFTTINDLDNVSGPADWFALATKRIQDVKKLADSIGVSLIETSNSKADVAILKRNAFVAVVVLCLIPIIWFGWILQRSISRRVKRIQRVLSQIDRDKDFTVRVYDSSEDELSDIINSLNQHLDDICTLLEDVQKAVALSSETLTDISSASSNALHDVGAQQTKTLAISSAVEEMSGSARTIAGDMERSSSITSQIRQSGDKSNRMVQDVSQSMNLLQSEISSSSGVVTQVSAHTESIVAILQTIEGIAEQTNLLALNAAIEAARAGEQGRGFAVVADEVRNLAKRTQDSTEQINGTIETLITSAKQASESMQKCLELTNQSAEKVVENKSNVDTLFADIESLNSAIEQVNHAVSSQAQVSNEISTDVQIIDEGASSMMVSSQNTNQLIQRLNGEFNEVATKLRRFKLSN